MRNDMANRQGGAGGFALAALSRVGAGLLGGYAFTWGFATLGIAGLAGLGVDFHDAQMVAMQLAFLVFLVVFLWAFAARRTVVVWAVLAGGGAAMTAAAWALQRILLA